MSEQIQQCAICCGRQVKELIDFGKQVVCHHFLKNPGERLHEYHLALGQCPRCATVQLTRRIPVEQLKPRYDWLKCIEPEGHLDDLVERLSRLPGISKDFTIGALSFKDDSTLERFNRLGFQNTWRVEPRGEMEISDAIVGFQSLQEHFHPSIADRLHESHGSTDILIVRHMVEHAYDFQGFIEAAKRLMSPKGYMVFEVPDCERAFEKCDLTTIWEEHPIYFTDKTFRNTFAWLGLSVVHFERVPYPNEDSYIAIVQQKGGVPKPEDDLHIEIARAEKFVVEFRHKKERLQRFLSEYHRKKGKVVVFGAGHVACIFLNLFGLKDHIDFVVDDDPHMRGLFMPGSGLPILESKALYEKDVKLCILTLSAASEEKVIKNNQRFMDKGGEFISVFSGSRWVMKI